MARKTRRPRRSPAPHGHRQTVRAGVSAAAAGGSIEDRRSWQNLTLETCMSKLDGYRPITPSGILPCSSKPAAARASSEHPTTAPQAVRREAAAAGHIMTVCMAAWINAARASWAARKLSAGGSSERFGGDCSLYTVRPWRSDASRVLRASENLVLDGRASRAAARRPSGSSLCPAYSSRRLHRDTADRGARRVRSRGRCRRCQQQSRSRSRRIRGSRSQRDGT